MNPFAVSFVFPIVACTLQRRCIACYYWGRSVVHACCVPTPPPDVRGTVLVPLTLATIAGCSAGCYTAVSIPFAFVPWRCLQAKLAAQTAEFLTLDGTTVLGHNDTVLCPIRAQVDSCACYTWLCGMQARVVYVK